jgi:hypothetical protein
MSGENHIKGKPYTGKWETWVLLNPLSGNAPHFIILLCLMPEDFTNATQWVNINSSSHLAR